MTTITQVCLTFTADIRDSFHKILPFITGLKGSTSSGSREKQLYEEAGLEALSGIKAKRHGEGWIAGMVVDEVLKESSIPDTLVVEFGRNISEEEIEQLVSRTKLFCETRFVEYSLNKVNVKEIEINEKTYPI